MAIGSMYYTGSRYDYDPSSVYSFSFGTSAPAKTLTPKPDPEFKAGDKITVKVNTTATVQFVNSGGSLDVKLADGTELDYFPADYATLTDPVNWPAKVGQVWKAAGKNYGVRRNLTYASEVVFYPIDQTGVSYGKGCGPGAELNDFKRLRPTLLG